MVLHRDLDPFYRELLSTAIQHNSIAILRHLVNNHAADLKTLSLEIVATVPLPSAATLDFLLAAGTSTTANNTTAMGVISDATLSCGAFWLTRTSFSGA